MAAWTGGRRPFDHESRGSSVQAGAHGLYAVHEGAEGRSQLQVAAPAFHHDPVDLEEERRVRSGAPPTHRGSWRGDPAHLCWAAVRGGQPVALLQQVYQVVDDHLALFLLPHLLHEHLKPDRVTGE